MSSSGKLSKPDFLRSRKEFGAYGMQYGETGHWETRCGLGKQRKSLVWGIHYKISADHIETVPDTVF